MKVRKSILQYTIFLLIVSVSSINMGIWQNILRTTSEASQWLSKGLASVRDVGRSFHEISHKYIAGARTFVDAVHHFVGPLPYISTAAANAKAALDTAALFVDGVRGVTELGGLAGDYLGRQFNRQD